MNEPMTNEQAADYIAASIVVEKLSGYPADLSLISALRAAITALRRVSELEAENLRLRDADSALLAICQMKTEYQSENEALRTQLDVAMRQIEVQNETMEQYAAQMDRSTEAEKQLDAIRAEVGPEPKYIPVVMDSGMSCTEIYIPMYVLDHYKHRAEHLVFKYIELREAAQALSTALEGAFISSWQSTASWDKQKDALAELLARGK